MKNFVPFNGVIIALLVLLSGCNQEVSNQDSNAPSVKETLDTVTYTALAFSESFEPELTVFPIDSMVRSMSELPEFDILHVVPDQVNSDGIGRFMHEIYGDDFVLDGLFKGFSGEVLLFYDKEKTKPAAHFISRKGKPDGKVSVFKLDGEILLEREYENGAWTKGTLSPACSDWKYDIKTSNLTINDLSNGDRFKGEARIVELMPSFDGASAYDEVLDPKSFKRPFLLNDSSFTGKLVAHSRIPEEDHYMRFELNFKNGLLHGRALVHDGRGKEVSLEEFYNGRILLPEPPPEPIIYELPEKPIIYFYPKETMDLTVQLKLDGKLTHTYPKYIDQWKVTAHPDGTLIDEKGKEYYALYWEGQLNNSYTLNEGNVVKGENTIAFLEEALETLGLNRREANEFIMYWLPRMENNAYNLIHFSTDEYEEMAVLDIQPKPETIIRVMMVFQPLKSSVSIPKQNLEELKQERKGFTVVEWGGQEANRTTIF